MFDDIKKDMNSRMESALKSLERDFSGLRAGRASASILDTVRVPMFDSKMPINQLGSVSVVPPRTLSVQIWDINNTTAVSKAIANSDLGLNPSVSGNVIHIQLPDLSEERRKELVKVAQKSAENCRVSVRNVRRHILGEVKKIEKKGEISEDNLHDYNNEIQKSTDIFIKKIDELLVTKEKDIMEQ